MQSITRIFLRKATPIVRLPHHVRQASRPQYTVRCFSSNSAMEQTTDAGLGSTCPEDLVKEAIKKMMLDRNSVDDECKPIDEGSIVHRFESLQKWHDEARLCILDCAEAAQSQHYDEELEAANAAVEKTFASFFDLVEDLQRSNNGLLQQYGEARLESATKLRNLRQELDAVRSRQ